MRCVATDNTAIGSSLCRHYHFVPEKRRRLDFFWVALKWSDRETKFKIISIQSTRMGSLNKDLLTPNCCEINVRGELKELPENEEEKNGSVFRLLRWFFCRFTSIRIWLLLNKSSFMKHRPTSPELLAHGSLSVSVYVTRCWILILLPVIFDSWIGCERMVKELFLRTIQCPSVLRF